MDAEKITELLRIHGNEITWESHLAFVDRMSQWEPSEILDYQESLVDYLVRGAWVNTSQNRVISLDNGTIDASGVRRQIELLEHSISRLSEDAPEGFLDMWERDLERLRHYVPEVKGSTPVPAGLIGVPLHPWMTPTFGEEEHEGRPVKRARLLKFVNYTDQGDLHELRLLLRAAPWAYRRRTGKRLGGIEPCRSEEFYTTSSNEWFTTVVRLRRGDDVVEYFATAPGPSAEYAELDHGGYYRAFARLLGATVDSISARPIDGIQASEHSWLVRDAQVISDRPAPAEHSEPNALSADIGTALFAAGTNRASHPRLAEDAFWKLIGLIDNEVSDESIEGLTTALAKKSVKSITGFQETLTDVLYRLDRPELTKPPGSVEPSTMSDDVFLYFRCEVVAHGLDAVNAVLVAGGIVEDDWPSENGESLLNIASNAFELKTGEPFEHETEFSYESASNTEAWTGVPPPAGEVPVGGVSVRSHSVEPDGSGRERVRFWATSSTDEALAAHTAAERKLWGANYRGVIDFVPLPLYERLNITKALARVSYYRPVNAS